MRGARMHAMMVVTSLVGMTLGLTVLAATAQAKTAKPAKSALGTASKGNPLLEKTAQSTIAPADFRISNTPSSAVQLQRPVQQDDLASAARLKIRFNDADSVRVLPNGRLLSLSGQNVSSMQSVLDEHNVQAISAVSMPESQVASIRASFEQRTGRPMEDIGGSIWLDGAPDAVDSALLALHDTGRLRAASFKSAPMARKTDKKRTPPTANTKQGRGLPLVMQDIHDVGLDFPEIPSPQQPPHVWQDPIFDVPGALKDHDDIVRHRVREAQQYAQDRNRDHMPPTRGVGVYCCVFTLTGLPGEELWEKRCEGSLGDMTADACDDLNIDGLSVAFVRAEWTGPGDPTNDCFTNCLDNLVPANNFGACCNVPGTRAGEDMLQTECFDAGGDFQGLTADPSTYLAYANCDACPQVWGNCCFENVDDTFFDFIWDNTNPVWDKSICNGEFPETQINEPTVVGIRMRSLDASGYTGWSATFDQLTAPAGWTWQDPDGPPSQMMNPTFIVNSRLMSNSEDETACERCTALGGIYTGDGTQPQTPVWDGLGGAVAICGQGIGIIDCATGETGPTNVLGPCCVGDGSPQSVGTPTITTFEACRDAATAANQNPFACWQMNMLMPANSLSENPEGTDIHQGFWRPWWIMHFTPPSAGTYAVPDIYEWFVPFWEYVGGYTPWTGWDSGRWWDEGFQPNYSPPGLPATTRDQFTQNIFPEFSVASGIMPCFPLDGVEVDATFINFYRPADYGPAIKFGLPPTCWELIPDYNVPQQPGDWFPWTDPETGAVWPVVPIVNPYVFEMQVIGVQGGDDFPNFFPWEYGWNRWTDDWKFFDIMRNAAQNSQLGFSPSYDFSGGTRYLNQRDSGLTSWMYLGDSNRPNPNPEMPPHDEEYGWPYLPDGNQGPGESGEPLRGSCYYQHSDFFPTIPGTEDKANFPGDQSCYSGTFCDEAACCDGVALFIPQCCTDGVLSEWNSLCVQIALDIVMADKMLGADFANWTCTGIHPFAVPEYPGSLPGSGISGAGQYDPDARNYRLNEYFQSTLPSDLQPSAAVPPLLPDGTANPNWPAYRRQVTMAARIAMFAPRCQGIYSSKGQCNIGSDLSGIGSWVVAAENDDLILGCQDYECCLRVIANMLTEKDTVGSPENDFDWIPRKWTSGMAQRANGYINDVGVYVPPACYLTTGGTWNLAAGPTPDFFPLQLHMGAKALVETLALTATAPKGSSGDVVRQIHGPNGQIVPAALVELIPAPLASGLRESSGQPLPMQNIYDVLPGPYYGGDGMAVYPGQTNLGFDGDFESLLKISQNYQALTNTEVGALGRGIQIGVLAESAYVQANATFGLGAVHEDLRNIQPDPFFDWSEVDPTTGEYVNKLAFDDNLQTSRGTAVLGVLGATSPTANWTDIDVSATGACVVPYFAPAGSCTDSLSQTNCHDLGGTWYTGISCASINDGADRASVPGTNTFGVQGMAPDARTWFFPTRTESGNRFEDAFLSAITVLQPGDVLMLAMNPNNYEDASGCLLLDPQVQEWVAVAQAFDIIVIAPAGDRQVALDLTDVAETLDLDALMVVGGAVPAADGNYLRWWSSNYSEADTVGGRLSTSVSICAWGGLVTTTGGNMNITRTMHDIASGAVLDSLVTQRGYTNDFGSQLDGSVAAAAQTAAATACVQGLTMQVYDEIFSPTSLITRMYDTAVTSGTNNGVGYNGAAGTTAGQYSWDLNELADGPNYVGRFPQLASLGLDIALLDPPDDGEIATLPPAYPVQFDVLVGTLVSGNVFYLRAPDDDLVIKVNSEPHGQGPINTSIWLPGGAYHLDSGNAIEIMATFKTSGVFNYADVFGLLGQRVGPNRWGMETPYMFNFTDNEWQQLNVATATTPVDANPTIFNYTVFDLYEWRDYLNPDTGDRHDEVYVRLGYNCADSPYQVEFDHLELMALDIPNNGDGDP